ncbi:MAG: hypothetical protein Q7T53_05510 [Deltaproteobacteria bacterium]|nr:hypothetical protein [Deltaproteobacteria bacterium]
MQKQIFLIGLLFTLFPLTAMAEGHPSLESRATTLQIVTEAGQMQSVSGLLALTIIPAVPAKHQQKEDPKAIADELALGGTIGAGLNMSLVNPWIGPVVDYWITDNIGVSVSGGLSKYFKAYEIRGNYLFDTRLDLYSFQGRPYLGLGYASVTGEEESANGISVTPEGSGLELFAGVLHHAPYISKNVYIRPELIYSSAAVEGEETGGWYGQTLKVDANYSAIGLGVAVVYYFR